MNAWGVPLHLRAAAEMYLKRLVVGGMDRIFEIGRIFRNEGADALNFPEFTVCEAYAVHTDYRDAAALAEKLVAAAAGALAGPECARLSFARHRFSAKRSAATLPPNPEPMARTSAPPTGCRCFNCTCIRIFPPTLGFSGVHGRIRRVRRAVVCKFPGRQGRCRSSVTAGRSSPAR